MERLDTGWVCLQVTGWHACPGPTLPSHLCIHRWHGCDRTARRAHRLRSACGRISPQSCSCRSQEGRHRRCQSCYHTFRKCTDMLREKEKGPSGLGVHSSVALSTFTLSCNHHHHPSPEFSSSQGETLYPETLMAQALETSTLPSCLYESDYLRYLSRIIIIGPL